MIVRMLTPADAKMTKPRISQGGEAPVPYHAKAVEDGLAGRTIPVADVTEVVARALHNATPLSHNGYKIPMARNIISRAPTLLLGRES